MTQSHFDIALTIWIDSELQSQLYAEATKRKQKPSTYARQLLAKSLTRKLKSTGEKKDERLVSGSCGQDTTGQASVDSET